MTCSLLERDQPGILIQAYCSAATNCCRLMAATWAARCGINARIIDKNASKVSSGQADGLQCRTLEIFDSFGFADRVWKEGSHM